MKDDIASFFTDTNADKIIVVENGWLKQIRKTKLYMYTFEPSSFELFDKNAGYYVSTEEMLPISVEPVGDLLEKIVHEKVELRFTPNLYPIRNRVFASSLGFSVIRFNHAKTE